MRRLSPLEGIESLKRGSRRGFKPPPGDHTLFRGLNPLKGVKHRGLSALRGIASSGGCPPLPRRPRHAPVGHRFAESDPHANGLPGHDQEEGAVTARAGVVIKRAGAVTNRTGVVTRRARARRSSGCSPQMPRRRPAEAAAAAATKTTTTTGRWTRTTTQTARRRRRRDRGTMRRGAAGGGGGRGSR